MLRRIRRLTQHYSQFIVKPGLEQPYSRTPVLLSYLKMVSFHAGTRVYIFLPGVLAGSLNLVQEAHLGKCPEIDISFPYVESLSSFHI